VVVALADLLRADRPVDPTAHYVWQSAAWIAGILLVFGSLAVMEYRKA
jgi:hypothetical protein